MCRAELVQLQSVQAALEKLGGTVMAVSVDPAYDARQVVERLGLAFPVLCDTERVATCAYGLLHKGGGPEGEDIPIPGHVLIDRSGRVVWRYVSRRAQDRPAPSVVLQQVMALAGDRMSQS
ncbi:MAG: redoxin domain-containing protein [Phycisphaerae bacterium]